MEEDRRRRKSREPSLARQRRWAWVGGGCVTLFVALVVAVMASFYYVSSLPPEPPPAPSVALPVPNARDEFIAAQKLLPEDPQDLETRIFRFGRDPKTRRPQAPTSLLREAARGVAPAARIVHQALHHNYATPAQPSEEEASQDVQGLTQLARWLALEGELRVREGQPTALLQAGLDTVQMGFLMKRGNSLIHFFDGSSVVALGQRSLEMAEYSTDASAAAHAARSLLALEAQEPSWADILTRVRPALLAEAFRLCRTEGPGSALDFRKPRSPFTSEREDLEERWQKLTTPNRKIIAAHIRFMDAEIARVSKPYYQWGPQPTPSDPVNREVLGFLTGAGLSSVWRRANLRVLRARFAIRAYTLKNGHLPARLTDLVPTYLPSVPQDPFAPAPLRYRVQNGKPLVYSLGPDGDDDGGKRLFNPGNINADRDGDLGEELAP